MKIEIRDSNPAVVDPPLEVWLCPTTDGQAVGLMGCRGKATYVIARLTLAGLELRHMPDELGLPRGGDGHVSVRWL